MSTCFIRSSEQSSVSLADTLNSITRRQHTVTAMEGHLCPGGRQALELGRSDYNSSVHVLGFPILHSVFQTVIHSLGVIH